MRIASFLTEVEFYFITEGDFVVPCGNAHAVGVSFVVLGIMNGGMEQVLGKAVRICTECIGLG